MTRQIDAKAPAVVNRRTFLKNSATTAALLVAARQLLPSGAYAPGAAPEVRRQARLHRADRFRTADHRQGKGAVRQAWHPGVEVLKQASWGATRDNLVLGGAANGIDGAHILSPLPYLMPTGKVTQNNEPVPMAILARLNLDSQAISVAKEYAETGVGLDCLR